ncbi:MAG: MarR family transcriptional regulator [Firmicutes bacterium]|nr:MarR family transcriptional regulator [Bacillota bacterium]
MSAEGEGGEHRRAVRRVLEVLPLLMRRWERDARATPWPGELSGGLADALALGRVAREPGLTAGELARALWMSESAVTAVLNRLEGAGLLVRQRQGHDRRVVHLALTERGRAVLEETERLRLDQMSRRFAYLSVADLERLADLLRKMAADGDGGGPGEEG